MKTGRCALAMFAVAAAALLAGCTSIGKPVDTSAILIRNVGVIPMDRPGLLTGQDVLIRNGRIEALARAGSLRVRAANIVAPS